MKYMGCTTGRLQSEHLNVSNIPKRAGDKRKQEFFLIGTDYTGSKRGAAPAVLDRKGDSNETKD